jgi:hypothetical protein
MRSLLGVLGLMGVSLCPGIALGQTYACTKGAGSVLANPQVINLYWSSNWDAANPPAMSRASIENFTRMLLQSNYFIGLEQYGVYTGTFAGGFAASPLCGGLDPNPGTTEADLTAWIECMVDTPGTHVPYPNADTVYVVYTPVGTAAPLCTQNGFNRASSVYGFPWAAVMAGCASSFATLGDHNALTATISHELAEIFTDPDGFGWTCPGGITDQISDGCNGGTPAAPSPTSLPDGSEGQFVSGQAWPTDSYWSNRDHACMIGDHRVDQTFRWGFFGGQMVNDWLAAPAALLTPQGQLEVWWNASGSPSPLQVVWQNSANGSWHTYGDFGGVLNPLVSPVVGVYGLYDAGAIGVFAVGSQGDIQQSWQNSAGGSWHGWASMGGTWGLGRLAVETNQDGRMEYFFAGPGGAVMHNYQVANGGGAWSGAVPMNGTALDGPAVARNQDGRLEVFVVGTDHALWHTWQTAPNSGWSGWSSLGGSWPVDAVSGGPMVIRSNGGQLQIFIRGSNGSVWTNWQNTAGGSWHGWIDFGKQMVGVAAGALEADTGMSIFVLGTDMALWNRRQTCSTPGDPSTCAWGSWTSLSGSLASSPAVAASSAGGLTVFAEGTDHQIWVAWENGPNGAWK